MQGILELELVPPVCLYPKGIVLTPEYPSAHVFGLHYEHAVARDDHMIDLRRASSGPYRYVIYINVIGRPQKELLRNDGLEFAEPARELQTRRHFDRHFLYARPIRSARLDDYRSSRRRAISAVW
jgi:hypothetical protein